MITSLNMNKFGGKDGDSNGINWAHHYIDSIIEFINDKHTTKNDCIILQEVNMREKPHQYFISKLPNNLKIHYPSNLKNKKPYGCTIAITTKEGSWEQKNSLDDGINYCNKTIQLLNTETDLTVLGVHMNGVSDEHAKDLWDKLIQFSSTNNKFLIIGDFNAYKEGDENYEVFNTLSKNYELDAWVKSGRDKSTRTFEGNTRIDYALTNVEFQTIDITNHLIDSDITDHEAVTIEY
ncbi:endonuclease/exonuclease/phosphatase family protein [Macrococcus equi]|uniref:endonuclease/exonuclease/phosphatase family protein n=1 Tax=Macrococcus equi TaxID=3395462 RepID=UPI0039BDE37F